METATGPAWALAIEHSAIGEAMRGGVWLYPLVETAHIVGFATLVGAILVLDLRLIGVGNGLRPAALIRLAVPVAASGFGLAALTGAALFATEATAYAGNPAFYAKQCLIALGLINVVVFHRTLLPRAVSWPADGPPPVPARLAASLSALLWIGALVCGRFIAYV